LITEFDHDGETRYLAAFEFMPGREPSESGDLASGFHQLGEITAKLHSHARQWQRPANFQRKVWNFDTTLGTDPHWGDWRQASGLDPDNRLLLENCVTLLQNQLEEYGTQASQFGLIHADLRLSNLLVDQQRLAVIDFDDCGFGWYMYDFAAAISFIETSPQIPSLQAAWVEGYRNISALSAVEVDALPMFIMLRRILLTAWIASHAETPTAVEMGEEYTLGTVSLAKAYLQRNN
jgi:Ser/Thr protein kinase RdoA (MazF antagonist)